MAAIHNATMVAARRLNHVETVPQQDSASTMLNKLARTFATQVEALRKYRSGGEQTIKVQHVTVNDGGQAIVGNVSQGGGGTSKNGGRPHGPCAADQCGPALLGHEQAQPACQCRAPALRGWKVCRFHGARGGAPRGKANAAWKHGRYTKEARAFLRRCAVLMKQAQKNSGWPLALTPASADVGSSRLKSTEFI